MSSHAEPPLLHVLPYLLPLLVADGSSASVALTCSSLRRLVHAQQQHLDLSSLSRHDDPDQAAVWAAEAGQHFPACTAVKCGVLQDSDFLLVQNILPALARLPSLNTLELSEAVDGALNSPALAMLFSSIGLQLPRLRRLSLHAAHAWLPSLGLAWQQLGKITQLTALNLDFSSVRDEPFALPDLAALSSLRSLEHLAVVVGARGWPRGWDGELAFLRDLTALTHLQLPLWVPAGLASMGRCQKLRCLRLLNVSDGGVGLSEVSNLWQVIGRLTALTELRLELGFTGGQHVAEQSCSTPACCDALKQLKELRVIHASVWAAPILDVFVALPHLHTVGGVWSKAGNAPEAQPPTLPQVTHCTALVAAGLRVPFGAFPNLLTVQLAAHCSTRPAAFAQLGSCTKLRRLEVISKTDQPLLALPQHVPTLTCSFSVFERVAAIHPLSKAQCLEYAAFKAHVDEEVTALVCALKGAPALSELSLSLVRSSQVTGMGLVQLAALRQLRKLSLLLFGTPLSQHAAQMLLCVLSHVPEVLLVVREAEHEAVIEAAMAACRVLSLALPASVEVQVAEG